MRRIEDDLLSPFSGQKTPAAICLGNFDGVHIGHQALLMENDRLAKEEGLYRRVLTFDPHPGILLGDPRVKLIDTREQKAEKIEETNTADELVMMRFTKDLMRMEAEDFFHEILLSRYEAKLITVGDDFHFGRGGKGNAELLEKLCAQTGTRLRVLERVLYQESPVSSSRIREALEDGRLEEASELLGKPYSLTGTVAEGKHVGRKLHAPTVNLMLEERQVIPRRGVYVSEITVRGMTLYGVSNVGINPTFGGEKPRVETYIFDFHEELYTEKIRVRLLKFLRPEKAFGSPDELREQITRDIENANVYVKERLQK